jgi:pSer/pThr/pTyr-binding forkhead associated (FHA) protein
VIRDDYTSSHHARLLLWGDQWMIQDLDSTNGTWHDGERVSTGPRSRGSADQGRRDDVRAEEVARLMVFEGSSVAISHTGKVRSNNQDSGYAARTSSSSPTAWAAAG